MSPRSQRANALDSTPAEVRASHASPITIVHEMHEPFQTDLDIKVRWKVSTELSRRVGLDAGGKLVGKRIVVATEDLRAYLRANAAPTPHAPPPTKPAKVRLVAARAKVPSAADIARANGLTVKETDK